MFGDLKMLWETMNEMENKINLIRLDHSQTNRLDVSFFVVVGMEWTQWDNVRDGKETAQQIQTKTIYSIWCENEHP